MVGISILVLIMGLALCAPGITMEYSQVMALKERVEQAIASGNVVLERDPRPINSGSKKRNRR